eukprot:PhF_6_TR10356/c0_g1_i1/m.16027
MQWNFWDTRWHCYFQSHEKTMLQNICTSIVLWLTVAFNESYAKKILKEKKESHFHAQQYFKSYYPQTQYAIRLLTRCLVMTRMDHHTSSRWISLKTSMCLESMLMGL